MANNQFTPTLKILDGFNFFTVV